jgi:hypothetical protein
LLHSLDATVEAASSSDDDVDRVSDEEVDEESGEEVVVESLPLRGFLDGTGERARLECFYGAISSWERVILFKFSL